MSSSTEHGAAAKDCEYSEFLEIMRGLPLFARVPLEVSKVLAYLSQAETFQPGDFLVREGEHAEAFFYLTRGRLQVTRQANGSAVSVKELGPGASFGGLALILGAKSLYSVSAMEEAEVMILAREKFLKTVQRFPQVEPALLRSLAEHVLAWEERFLNRHPEEFASLGRDFGLSLF
jgi:CRP-like cAMP-binding protein